MVENTVKKTLANRYEENDNDLHDVTFAYYPPSLRVLT